jgi:phospholipid/cholesterol/gamma-HCH transport system substrate-binding protein
MMERHAHYALIGLFTFAVVAGAFGFTFWLHHSSGKKQAVAYRVIFDSSVSGLQVGGNVLFNGIRVGQVTNLRLDPDKPSQVIAMLAINKSTPIRSDTHVGLEFSGLTGVAAVSLKGASPDTPLIEREEGEPPTLRADSNASQDMMQAAREVLNKVEEVIAANEKVLHDAFTDIGKFSASLARNADNVDSIVSDVKDTANNAKAATASARVLMDNLDKRTDEITAGVNKMTASGRLLMHNLDKRTDEITAGVNKMTATATRQIDLAGRAITDLAHNPQRLLFGGSNNSEAVPTPATTGTSR